jgi:hypothetical protein
MLSWYPNSTLHCMLPMQPPMVTLKILPYTNVTLTFDFDFGLDHPVHGGYGWGSPIPRRRSNCQTKKLKSGHVSCNITWNWNCIIALHITDCPLIREGAPHQQTRKCLIIIKERRGKIDCGSQKGARQQDRLADQM